MWYSVYIICMMLSVFSLQSGYSRQAQKAAQEAKSKSLAQTTYQPLLTDADINASDEQFLKKVHTVFEKELWWLRNGTLEGSGESAGGKDDEYLRTLDCLLSLKWVLSGNYDQLVSVQFPAAKLTKAHFNDLAKFTTKYLDSPFARDAMFVFLLINDLGKITEVKDHVNKKTGEHSDDHDVILSKLLEQYSKLDGAQFTPTFGRLTKQYQGKIIAGQNADLNFGQFLQAENLPANLAKVSRLSKDDLIFFIIHSIYDIAGAAGHTPDKGLKGSIALVDPAYLSMVNAREALFRENRPDKIYETYLVLQAKRFGYVYKAQGKTRAILRLALMNRAGSLKDVLMIESVFNKLDKQAQQNLITELNKTGSEDSGILVYYGPALFANAKKKIAEIAPLTLEETYINVMNFLSRVFTKTRSLLVKKAKTGVFVINVRSVAQLILNKPSILRSDLNKIPHSIVIKNRNEADWHLDLE